MYPFAGLAELVPETIGRILINRETVGTFGHRKNDIILKGDIVDVVKNLDENITWNS